MAPFTFSIELEPRYRDLDPNGHVNQAVFASYFEQARTKYWDAVGLPMDDVAVAMVHQEIDYRAELSLGQECTVAMRVDELGRSSIPIENELSTVEGVAATTSVVLVAFDVERRTSRPIPDEWRDAIEAYEASHGNEW